MASRTIAANPPRERRPSLELVVAAHIFKANKKTLGRAQLIAELGQKHIASPDEASVAIDVLLDQGVIKVERTPDGRGERAYRISGEAEQYVQIVASKIGEF